MCSQEVGGWTIYSNLSYFGKFYFACFKFKWRFINDIEMLGERLVRSIELLGLKVIGERSIMHFESLSVCSSTYLPY
jgi:hypothetical protein